MLKLLHKYQRYIYLLITIVIVISFSFFGTYSTIAGSQIRDQIAFTTVDGTKVPRSELDEFALFIGTDQYDKLLYGGAWGPNFLNDGIIKSDFLQTGLAEILVAAYPSVLKEDLENKLEREQKYKPYVNPWFKFLSAENIWATFAPGIMTNLTVLRNGTDPVSPELFGARVNLYLAERRFPAPALSQVLRYQEKQYGWIKPDETLTRSDLSLFGYHSLDDWFGPHFTRLVAEFIINAAAIAEQKGYQVSKAEAIADLYHNAANSFKELANQPNLGLTTVSDYYAEQLRRMGMDQTMAAKIWRKVLLFRRAFQDIGNAVFLDQLPFQKLNDYASKTVEGDLYRLPPEFRFGDYRTLQKFETYLDAISKRPQDEKGLLELPKKFYTPEEVSKKYPELVQKRYVLEVAGIDKKSLQAKVSLKDMWNWEVENTHWEALKKQFPDLGVQKGDTSDERLKALDSLDAITRSKVDQFAREKIVDEHPEWIKEALKEAPSEKMVEGIRLKGGLTNLPGIDKPEVLIALLDKASIGEQSDALKEYTQNKENFYRINVLEKPAGLQILSFFDANSDGTLDKLLDRQLETYYIQNRQQNPTVFQKEDKTWKSFEEAKTEVANLYFAKLLAAIAKDYAATPGVEQRPNYTGDISASIRFFALMRQTQDHLKKNPKDVAGWVQEQNPNDEDEKSLKSADLAAQWKPLKATKEVERSAHEDWLNKDELFALKPNSWSSLKTPPNGDIVFFFVDKFGQVTEKGSEWDLTVKAYDQLAADAQRLFMGEILPIIQEKGAISFSYLNVGQSSELSPQ
jgi:GcvH upstream region-like protein